MKNNIKVLREQKKMTQQECATVFGVKLRAWQTYEQGISEPKYEMLCKIADYFNVTLDYLLGRELPPPPTDKLEVLGIEKNVDDDEFMRLYSQLPYEVKQIFVDTMAKLSRAANIERPKRLTEASTLQKPNIQESRKAIARSKDKEYLDVPTSEQMASFTPIPEDSEL